MAAIHKSRTKSYEEQEKKKTSGVKEHHVNSKILGIHNFRAGVLKKKKKPKSLT